MTMTAEIRKMASGFWQWRILVEASRILSYEGIAVRETEPRFEAKRYIDARTPVTDWEPA